MPGSSSKPKPKPYRQPQLLTLPSVVAHPLEDADRNYFTFTFLPIADLRGHSLFQAFVRFCSASELNAVLVSRAFVSQTYTKQGQMLTVRQVPLMPAVFEIQQTLSLAKIVAPFFCLCTCLAWYFPQNSHSCSV